MRRSISASVKYKEAEEEEKSGEVNSKKQKNPKEISIRLLGREEEQENEITPDPTSGMVGAFACLGSITKLLSLGDGDGAAVRLKTFPRDCHSLVVSFRSATLNTYWTTRDQGHLHLLSDNASQDKKDLHK
ncbi:hypothetical protein KQX54_021217 [Cotesia glomerata]|uniref:Uncharacterized protein n=1 Tax=Cotesia glomerata TaxID=32391 RepID=A0AAV7I5V2_COTGL|nr:hypothetical protein KQX54_021217 [Cotesia glomerata]